MVFHIESKKIAIDESLITQYINITHDSLNAMQLILTVMLRNALKIDDPREILKKYSEDEIKETLESKLRREVVMLSA